jgi:hypothetical protein
MPDTVDLMAVRRERTLAQLHRVEALRRIWLSPEQTADVLAETTTLPAEAVPLYLARVAAWCARYNTDNIDGEPADEVVAHAVDVALHRLKGAA